MSSVVVSVLSKAACGVALLLAGCSAPAPRAPEPQSQARVQFFKSKAPLTETSEKTLPLWLVATEIALAEKRTVSTQAIVDTGAQATVIDRAFAIANGIEVVSSNVVTTDFAGARLPTQVARGLRLRFGAVETRQLDAVVVELPEVFHRLQIGVIWSPHTSTPRDAMFRMDFAKGTLQLLPESAIASNASSLCLGVDDGFPHGAPTVDVMVGDNPAKLDLDSGSNKAVFLSLESRAGMALGASDGGKREMAMGAGGKSPTREIPAQTIRFGSFATTGPVTLAKTETARKEQCQSDGMIGLPVLEHCRLDVTSRKFALTCGD